MSSARPADSNDWAPSGWSIAALACIAAALALFATSRFGIISYSDSTRYLSIARSLANGDGFRNSAGAYDVLLGPLYPMVLAVAIRMHIDALAFARVLHAVLYGATIGLVGIWLRDARCSRGGWWCGALFAATSVALFAQGTTELTDMLFIFLTAAGLVAFDRCLRQNGASGWLVTSGIAVGFAAATRYLGVTLVAAGCLLLLLPRRAPMRRRLGETFAWGLAASLPLWVWLARNYRLSGSLFGGTRLETGFTAATFVGRTLATVGDWWLPGRLPIAVRASLGGLVACAIVATCIASLRGDRSDGAPTPLGISMRTASSFWLAYTIAMVAYCVTSWATDYPERYMAPVVVPMALLIGGWVTRLSAARIPRRLSAAVPAIALLALLWPARLLEGSALYLFRHGGGYGGDRWRTSALLEYLRAQAPRGRLYSNEPNAIYMLTPLRAVEWVPMHDGPGAWISADSALRRFRSALAPADSIHFILFAPIPDELAGYRYTRAQLESFFEVTTEHEAPDGAILGLLRRPDGVSSGTR